MSGSGSVVLGWVWKLLMLARVVSLNSLAIYP